MKQNLPSTLSDFQCFFLDESWAGVMNKITLPDIEFKTETFTPSATGGERKKVLPTVKEMVAKLTVGDYNEKIIGMIGNPSGRDEQLTFMGDIDRDGENIGIKITMQGDWYKMAGGDKESGGQTIEMEVEGSLFFYSIEIDGQASLYIDLENRVYKPDGKTDVWEKIRKNIGL